MTDTRATTVTTADRARLRQRSERALLAAYVHELSERHRGVERDAAQRARRAPAESSSVP
jgi:hypothetical protein